MISLRHFHGIDVIVLRPRHSLGPQAWFAATLVMVAVILAISLAAVFIGIMLAPVFGILETIAVLWLSAVIERGNRRYEILWFGRDRWLLRNRWKHGKESDIAMAPAWLRMEVVEFGSSEHAHVYLKDAKNRYRIGCFLPDSELAELRRLLEDRINRVNAWRK